MLQNIVDDVGAPAAIEDITSSILDDIDEDFMDLVRLQLNLGTGIEHSAARCR